MSLKKRKYEIIKKRVGLFPFNCDVRKWYDEYVLCVRYVVGGVEEIDYFYFEFRSSAIIGLSIMSEYIISKDMLS